MNYLGEERVFAAEQLVAALLVKLKEITEHNLHEVSKVTDCVLSVSICKRTIDSVFGKSLNCEGAL